MRPGCGLVFGVWGVDRRPDPTAKLTFVGKPYAGPQCLIPIQGEWGGLGPGPHADSSPTEEEEEERERERVAILAQAVSGSSPWGALCEPFLLLVFSTPHGTTDPCLSLCLTPFLPPHC